MSHYSEFVNDNPDLRSAIELLDKWAKDYCFQKHLPALGLGLVHNGELLWGNAYGFANLEQKTPLTLDSRFRIASISKTFTATAILQLYDAGKLRLDDPLSKYLAWFDLRYPDAPEITIYHCLTHTSGLPRDATVPHWTENVFQSWDEVQASIQNRQPVLPPLQAHGYSNLGYTLLGGVIEAVSGLSWADYLLRNIIAPLGMSNTLPTPKGNEGNLVTGYLAMDEQYQRAAVPFIETKGFSPSASVASSVNDLVKYAKFHLSKGQTPILSAYSLREMHRPHWVWDNWSQGYGLGTRIWRVGEWTVSGHAGGYKGFITRFSVCREHDFGVIALTNAIDALPHVVMEEAYKLVMPEIIKLSHAAPEADPAWQDYLGTYRNDWGDFEVVVRHGQLQLVDAVFPRDEPVILEATETPDVFTIRSSSESPETARFERDATGKVLRYFNRSEYSFKKN